MKRCGDMATVGDRNAAEWVDVIPSANPHNTGGGDVFGDIGWKVNLARPAPLRRQLPETSIRFLKLDCEGSEFPILLGNDLSRVVEIAGEYHELGPGTFHADRRPIPEWAQIPGLPSWTRQVLRDHLRANGFDVELNHEAENIGKFFAKNKRFLEAHR